MSCNLQMTALLTITRTGAEKALQEYNLVWTDSDHANDKSNGDCREATEVDMAPISLGAEEVENVSQYQLNAFHHRCVRTVLASPEASRGPNTSPPGN